MIHWVWVLVAIAGTGPVAWWLVWRSIRQQVDVLEKDRELHRRWRAEYVELAEKYVQLLKSDIKKLAEDAG